MLVPCFWLSSGALEVWRFWLRLHHSRPIFITVYSSQITCSNLWWIWHTESHYKTSYTCKTGALPQTKTLQQQWRNRNRSRNHNLQTSKAPLKSQKQGTNLFTSTASHQRGCPKHIVRRRLRSGPVVSHHVTFITVVSSDAPTIFSIGPVTFCIICNGWKSNRWIQMKLNIGLQQF